MWLCRGCVFHVNTRNEFLYAIEWCNQKLDVDDRNVAAIQN